MNKINRARNVLAVCASIALVTPLAMAQTSGTTGTSGMSGSGSGMAGSAGDRKTGKLTNEEFVKKAGAAGAAEVAAGNLGAQKATNPEVKAFAQQMVTDHTKANTELMAAAKAKNLEVPTEPDLMHKAAAKKMEHQKADAEFDADFMDRMVSDHEKVVELFQTAASDTSLDADLRAWAKKTLPALQEHLTHARTLQSKVSKKA
jgi:putative membrane protein